MANGLPDEARGVIPALMINNIKMKTKSILQSFQYTEKVNTLLYYGQETKTLQIIQPLSSFHNQAQMHPQIIWYKLMKPIEKTIHSQMMDSKHKLLFTLVLSLLSLLSILTGLKQLDNAKMKKKTRCLNILLFLPVTIIDTNISVSSDVR